jgi:glycosyltransferase involved in cell wall biosynthesis
MTETTVINKLRIAVCIATKGRAGVLVETLTEIRRQTRTPDRILVCYAEGADVTGLPNWPEIGLIKGPQGLTAQRNVLLDAATDCDIVLFFDDDFLPAPQYIDAIERVFCDHDEVIVTTGKVIADGAKGPGFSYDFARQVLAADLGGGPWSGLSAAWCGYGCNMAIRSAKIRGIDARFDERLALYGWYEDIDFTRRLGEHGKIIRVEAARGVHLGVKSGRTSGRRLGYSQVMNCVYLARKGTCPWKHALRSILKHLAVNLCRSVWPEAWVDRRGRLLGNLIALCDVCRGSMTPERVSAL